MAQGIDSNTVSVIGAFGVMITGFWALARTALNQSAKDRNADRTERQQFIKAIKSMAVGMDKVANSNKTIANETRKGNEEAKARNGHLGEQNIQIAELVKATKADVLNAVQEVKVQHVVEQKVDKTIIKP